LPAAHGLRHSSFAIGESYSELNKFEVVDILFDVVVLLVARVTLWLVFVDCTREFSVHGHKRELLQQSSNLVKFSVQVINPNISDTLTLILLDI